jgi:polysaccharide biosynthesis/export protein
MRFWLIAVCALGMLVSCVPNRKYVYLQKEDVNKKDLPKDNALRSYTTEPFDYKIQPNDALYVRFESLTAEEYDFLAQATGGGGNNAFVINSNLVDANGDIRFPQIGKVHVAGLTVFQIQDTLQALADESLDSPSVRVRLVNFRFTLLGEVNVEGTVTTFNNRVTLPEAIGLAGGIGELADRANVKIIRQNGDKTEVGYVNLLSEDLMKSPYYYINQSDVIVVPALKQRPFRRYFGPNLALVISSVSVLLLALNLTK